MTDDDSPERVPYVTASTVRKRWPDVDADRLRDWKRRGLVSTVTVAELAAALGVLVPDGRDPHAPARAWSPVSGRWENVYRWVEVVRAEKRTGEATAGQTRTLAA